MSKFRTKLILFTIGGPGLSLSERTAQACPAIIEHSRQETGGAELCSNLQFPGIRLPFVYSTGATFELEEAMPAGMMSPMASRTIAGCKWTIMLNGTGSKAWA